MDDAIRLLLIDDHRLFRDGLRAILGAHRDLAVVGEAGDYGAAVEVAERTPFDLAVLDITLRTIARGDKYLISVKTVETHRTRIMRKLDVHNVGELVRLAARHGFLAA